MNRFALSEDGWADAVTFSVTLRNLSVEEYESWKLASDALPVQILPDYLRASVRQLCFDSLVGKSLALLHFRARDLVEEPERLANVLARFEAGLCVLQPVVEGLAGLAMFDQNVHETDLLSYPISEIPYYFLQMGARGSEDIPPHEIQEMLAEARVGIGEGWRRKTKMLKEHLDCRLDTRLTGYLALKNLQRALTQRAQMEWLRNGEIYSILLVETFFQDPGIVMALLDHESDLETTVHRIAQSVKNRLDWLAQVDSDVLRRYFQMQVSELDDIDLDPLDVLHDPDATRRAEALMDRWHDPIREDPAWVEFAWAAFSSRPPLMLYLLDNKEELESGEVFDMPSTLCEETSIRDGLPHEATENDVEEYNARVAIGIHSRQELIDQRDHLFQLAHEQSSYDIETLITQTLPERANEFFRDWALAYVAPESKEQTRFAMSERGLQGLGLSANALETLALVSIFDSERLSRRNLLQECAERGLDLEAAEKEWRHVTATYGLPLTEGDSASLRTLV